MRYLFDDFDPEVHFTHDCSRCKHIGEFSEWKPDKDGKYTAEGIKRFDVYICGTTLLIRYGNDEAEYGSHDVQSIITASMQRENENWDRAHVDKYAKLLDIVLQHFKLVPR